METIILLGPSGSGKTTRIDDYRDELLHNMRDMYDHINRDGIALRFTRAAGIDPRTVLPNEEAQVKEIFARSHEEFIRQRDVALTSRSTDTLIDITPGTQQDWMIETATKSKALNRRVVVEGIFAEPEVTLPRVLTRDTRGLTVEEVPSHVIMNPDSTKFRKWLTTYQRMPDLFADMVGHADEARLLYNPMNGSTPREFGVWRGGKIQSLNETLYARFQQLRDLNIEGASFKADISHTRRISGMLHHSFDVTTYDFRPPQADAPADNGPTRIGPVPRRDA